MATKAELLATNEALEKHVKELHGRVDAALKTVNEVARDRDRWLEQNQRNYSEMRKERARADNAEANLQKATILLGALVLEEWNGVIKLSEASPLALRAMGAKT